MEGTPKKILKKVRVAYDKGTQGGNRDRFQVSDSKAVLKDRRKSALPRMRSNLMGTGICLANRSADKTRSVLAQVEMEALSDEESFVLQNDNVDDQHVPPPTTETSGDVEMEVEKSDSLEQIDEDSDGFGSEPDPQSAHDSILDIDPDANSMEHAENPLVSPEEDGQVIPEDGNAHEDVTTQTTISEVQGSPCASNLETATSPRILGAKQLQTLTNGPAVVHSPERHSLENMNRNDDTSVSPKLSPLQDRIETNMHVKADSEDVLVELSENDQTRNVSDTENLLNDQVSTPKSRWVMSETNISPHVEGAQTAENDYIKSNLALLVEGSSSQREIQNQKIDSANNLSFEEHPEVTVDEDISIIPNTNQTMLVDEETINLDLMMSSHATADDHQSTSGMFDNSEAKELTGTPAGAHQEEDEAFSPIPMPSAADTAPPTVDNQEEESDSDSDSLSSISETEVDQRLTFDIETLRPQRHAVIAPPPDDTTTVVSPPTSLDDPPATPSQTYKVTLNDDETLLHDFLNRAKASKAAKIAKQESESHRRDSDVVKHALARDPLHEVDSNSPPQVTEGASDAPAPSPTLTLDLPRMSAQPSTDDSNLGSPRRATRRSSRVAPHKSSSHTHTPAGDENAPATEDANEPTTDRATRTPRSITLARHTEPPSIKKTEAQQLSLATRQNTRRNKGGSVHVRIMLLRLKEGGLPPEACGVTSPSEGGNGGEDKAGAKRSVRWNEELVSFFEGEKRVDEDVEKAEEVPEKPKARRRSALGGGNGTPARVRTKSLDNEDVEQGKGGEKKRRGGKRLENGGATLGQEKDETKPVRASKRLPTPRGKSEALIDESTPVAEDTAQMPKARRSALPTASRTSVRSSRR